MPDKAYSSSIRLNLDNTLSLSASISLSVQDIDITHGASVFVLGNQLSVKHFVNPISLSPGSPDLRNYGIPAGALAIINVRNGNVSLSYWFNLETYGVSYSSYTRDNCDIDDNNYVQRLVPTHRVNGRITFEREDDAITAQILGYVGNELAGHFSGQDIDVTPGTSGSYQTVTVSNVPDYAEAVITTATGISVSYGVYARAIGSTVDLFTGNTIGHQLLITGLNASKQFEAYVESTTNNELWATGWFHNDRYVAKTDPLQITLSNGTNTYDLDSIDTVPSNAIAVVIAFRTTAVGYSYGVWHPDQDGNVDYYNAYYATTMMVSTFNANHEVRILAQNTSVVFAYIAGYIVLPNQSGKTNESSTFLAKDNINHSYGNSVYLTIYNNNYNSSTTTQISGSSSNSASVNILGNQHQIYFFSTPVNLGTISGTKDLSPYGVPPGAVGVFYIRNNDSSSRYFRLDTYSGASGRSNRDLSGTCWLQQLIPVHNDSTVYFLGEASSYCYLQLVGWIGNHYIGHFDGSAYDKTPGSTGIVTITCNEIEDNSPGVILITGSSISSYGENYYPIGGPTLSEDSSEGNAMFIVKVNDSKQLYGNIENTGGQSAHLQAYLKPDRARLKVTPVTLPDGTGTIDLDSYDTVPGSVKAAVIEVYNASSTKYEWYIRHPDHTAPGSSGYRDLYINYTNTFVVVPMNDAHEIYRYMENANLQLRLWGYLADPPIYKTYTASLFIDTIARHGASVFAGEEHETTYTATIKTVKNDVNVTHSASIYITGDNRHFHSFPSPTELTSSATDVTSLGVPVGSLAIVLVDNTGSGDYAWSLYSDGASSIYRDFAPYGLCQCLIPVPSSGIVRWSRENSLTRFYLTGYIGAELVGHNDGDRIEVSPTTAGSYQTRTASNVEDLAAGVILERYENIDSAYSSHCRPAGSSHNLYASGQGQGHELSIVLLNTSKQFEAAVENTSNNDIYSIAWFKVGRAELKLNPIYISRTATTETVDLDSVDTVPSNAVAAVLEFRNINTTSDYYFSAYQPGTTGTPNGVLTDDYSNTMMVAGINENNEVTIYRSSSFVYCYLVGYIVIPDQGQSTHLSTVFIPFEANYRASVKLGETYDKTNQATIKLIKNDIGVTYGASIALRGSQSVVAFFDSLISLPVGYVNLTNYGVPIGALAIIQIYNNSPTNYYYARAEKSGDTIRAGDIYDHGSTQRLVPTDETGEIYLGRESSFIGFRLMGYIGTDFFDRGSSDVDKGSGTVTCSEIDDNSPGVIMTGIQTYTFYTCYAYPVGGASHYSSSAYTPGHQVYHVKVNASKQIVISIENATYDTVYLTAWYKPGKAILKQSSVAITGVTGDFDLRTYDDVPINAQAAIIEVYNASAGIYESQVRGTNQPDIGNWDCGGQYGQTHWLCELDATRQIYFYRENASVDLYVWGYLIGAPLQVTHAASLFIDTIARHGASIVVTSDRVRHTASVFLRANIFTYNSSVVVYETFNVTHDSSVVVVNDKDYKTSVSLSKADIDVTSTASMLLVSSINVTNLSSVQILQSFNKTLTATVTTLKLLETTYTNSIDLLDFVNVTSTNTVTTKYFVDVTHTASIQLVSTVNKTHAASIISQKVDINVTNIASVTTKVLDIDVTQLSTIQILAVIDKAYTPTVIVQKSFDVTGEASVSIGGFIDRIYNNSVISQVSFDTTNTSSVVTKKSNDVTNTATVITLDTDIDVTYLNSVISEKVDVDITYQSSIQILKQFDKTYIVTTTLIKGINESYQSSSTVGGFVDVTHDNSVITQITADNNHLASVIGRKKFDVTYQVSLYSVGLVNKTYQASVSHRTTVDVTLTNSLLLKVIYNRTYQSSIVTKTVDSYVNQISSVSILKINIDKTYNSSLTVFLEVDKASQASIQLVKEFNVTHDSSISTLKVFDVTLTNSILLKKTISQEIYGTSIVIALDRVKSYNSSAHTSAINLETTNEASISILEEANVTNNNSVVRSLSTLKNHSSTVITKKVITSTHTSSVANAVIDSDVTSNNSIVTLEESSKNLTTSTHVSQSDINKYHTVGVDIFGYADETYAVSINTSQIDIIRTQLSSVLAVLSTKVTYEVSSVIQTINNKALTATVVAAELANLTITPSYLPSAEYLFDEIDIWADPIGTRVAKDSSGNQYDLTITAPDAVEVFPPVQGTLGRGFKLDGSEWYAIAAYDHGAPAAVSVSFFIVFSELTPATVYHLMGSGPDLGNARLLVEINDRKVRFTRTADKTYATSTTNLSIDTLYHIVLIWDQSGNWEIYIDNSLDASGTVDTVAHPFATSQSLFFIGGEGSDAPHSVIDQVKFFSYTLDSGEVDALNGEVPVAKTLTSSTYVQILGETIYDSSVDIYKLDVTGPSHITNVEVTFEYFRTLIASVRTIYTFSKNITSSVLAKIANIDVTHSNSVVITKSFDKTQTGSIVSRKENSVTHGASIFRGPQPAYHGSSIILFENDIDVTYTATAWVQMHQPDYTASIVSQKGISDNLNATVIALDDFDYYVSIATRKIDTDVNHTALIFLVVWGENHVATIETKKAFDVTVDNTVYLEAVSRRMLASTHIIRLGRKWLSTTIETRKAADQYHRTSVFIRKRCIFLKRYIPSLLLLDDLFVYKLEAINDQLDLVYDDITFFNKVGSLDERVSLIKAQLLELDDYYRTKRSISWNRNLVFRKIDELLQKGTKQSFRNAVYKETDAVNTVVFEPWKYLINLSHDNSTLDGDPRFPDATYWRPSTFDLQITEWNTDYEAESDYNRPAGTRMYSTFLNHHVLDEDGTPIDLLYDIDYTLLRSTWNSVIYTCYTGFEYPIDVILVSGTDSLILEIANDLKAKYNAHIDNLDYHNAKGSIYGYDIDVNDATDIDSFVVLVNQIRSRYSWGHRTNTLQHNVADTVNYITHAPATDMIDGIELLEELVTKYNAHLATASHNLADTINVITTPVPSLLDLLDSAEDVLSGLAFGAGGDTGGFAILSCIKYRLLIAIKEYIEVTSDAVFVEQFWPGSITPLSDIINFGFDGTCDDIDCGHLFTMYHIDVQGLFKVFNRAGHAASTHLRNTKVDASITASICVFDDNLLLSTVITEDTRAIAYHAVSVVITDRKVSHTASIAIGFLTDDGYHGTVVIKKVVDNTVNNGVYLTKENIDRTYSSSVIVKLDKDYNASVTVKAPRYTALKASVEVLVPRASYRNVVVTIASPRYYVASVDLYKLNIDRTLAATIDAMKLNINKNVRVRVHVSKIDTDRVYEVSLDLQKQIAVTMNASVTIANLITYNSSVYLRKPDRSYAASVHMTY